MSVPPEQAEVAALLTAISGVEPIETHISLVFVGADTVFKLKKAVKLPYLDFTHCQQRRRFALRELELNRVAAPGLYRDIVPVVRSSGGLLRLNEHPLAAGAESDTDIVDWVLRMARVPTEHFLDYIATHQGLSPRLLDDIGDCVASYHAALPPARVDGQADAVRLVTMGNAKSAIEAGLPAGPVAQWMERALEAINRRESWLEGRARLGLVRRAHGDLHLDNMCLWQGRPVPFDALEFDEEMATIDLAYDLAFLLMDLDHRVSREAASRVLNRYIAATGDVVLVNGLPPFLSLRAFVRAHVEARREHHDAALAYFEAAMRYLNAAPAVAVAIGGLPGTGKSTLARALAPGLGTAPGALVLRSDEIRKRLHGVAPEQPLPPAAYTEQVSGRVFATLADGVKLASAARHAVIADATFLDLAHRAAVERAASDVGVPFLGIWLDAPLPILEQRLGARVYDASDATVGVLREANLRNPGARDWLAVDASDGEAALRRVREAIAARLAQAH
jgi:aminoglycoside phosphotransferase family enzyme/predicted kinase